MLRRQVGDDELVEAVEAERAHGTAGEIPAAQVPVLVHRLQAQRIHDPALRAAARAPVVELDAPLVRDGAAQVVAGPVARAGRDRDLAGARRGSARQLRHELADEVEVAGVGLGGDVLEPGDEGGRLPRREARRVVDGDHVRDDDLVVVLEVVPGDVEQVAVLVRGGGSGHAGHGDEAHRLPDLLGRHPEVRRRLAHADATVVGEVRHEGQQERQLVLRLERRGAVGHDASSRWAATVSASRARTASRSRGGAMARASGPKPATSSANRLVSE
ncbi:hypothetical protein ABID70_000966 [Clavibacter michiganensis]